MTFLHLAKALELVDTRTSGGTVKGSVCECSLPRRDSNQQGVLVYNKPVKDLSFPLLETRPKCH